MPKQTIDTLITPEAQTDRGIVGLNAFPGMNPEIIDIACKDAKVLILITNAGGGISSDLLPNLERLTQRGVAVFALPEHNPEFAETEKGKGIVYFNGQPQVDAQNIGVTYLEKAGTLDIPEVYEALIKALDDGFEGPALAELIRAEFAYSPEDRPAEPDAVALLEEFNKKLRAEGL